MSLGKFLIAGCTFAVTLVASSAAALACSPEEPPESGYIGSLKVSIVVTDDRSSPVACSPKQGSSCGPDVRYQGARRLLSVRPAAFEGPKSGAVHVDGRAPLTYVLKDAMGQVVESSPGSLFGTSFTKTGDKVCLVGSVKAEPLMTEDAGQADAGLADASPGPDAGSSGGSAIPPVRPFEICAAVTESLVVTEADLAQYKAGLTKDCGTAGDAGSSDGGCNVGSASSGTSMIGAALVSIVGLALTRRRKMHEQ
jgi:MYXO-CTERM domain-containing protein